PDVRFVNLNVAAFDAAKHAGEMLVADARAGLEALTDALSGHRTSSTWDVSAWNRTVDEAFHLGNTPLPAQTEVLGALNEVMDARDVVVQAAGSMPGDLQMLWRAQDPKQYHVEYAYSCMGYEIAGALGVKMARPERDVWALVGDGSYLMLHGELVTSLQEDRKITVLLIDNGGYQCIHGLQRHCGGRSFGNEFRRRRGGRLEGELLPIDYAANAASLGAAAFRAESEAELADSIAAARAETRSVLVHVRVEAGPPIPSWAWWEVPMADGSNVPGVREARERWAAARAEQRYYYRGSP
ncbi:MAG: thiamine pyrophosphate-dependent enzyme, partial [bacterium]